jgi:hypothetical protein
MRHLLHFIGIYQVPELASHTFNWFMYHTYLGDIGELIVHLLNLSRITL